MKYLVSILFLSAALAYIFPPIEPTQEIRKRSKISHAVSKYEHQTVRQKPTPIPRSKRANPLVQEFYPQILNLDELEQAELDKLRFQAADLAKAQDDQFRKLLFHHLDRALINRPVTSLFLIESHILYTEKPEQTLKAILQMTVAKEKSSTHKHSGYDTAGELNIVKAYALDKYFERGEKMAEEPSKEVKELLKAIAQDEADLMLVRDSLQHLARSYGMEKRELKELVEKRESSEHFAFEDLI